MLAEKIQEVALLWPNYRLSAKTNKNSRIHELVVSEIPKVLHSWLNNSEKYLCTGSEGQGNLLNAPWIAVFDKSITNSAQRGYYVVFLLSEDMKSLTLEIGFGATQFKEKYGSGKEFFLQLDRAVSNMRLNSQHLIKKSLHKSLDRTNSQEVRLDSSGNFLLKAYEKCAIYSLNYEISNLNDEVLNSDFKEFINLYAGMVNSLLLAEVEDYVVEQLEVPEVSQSTEISEFSPRIKKRPGSHRNLNKNSNGNQRRSKRADKIGRIGEEWVFEFEKEKLIKLGKVELANKVIWHRDYVDDRTPGWDITSFDSDGKNIYIEVKSSEGKTINDFILTAQEWTKANSELAPFYYVYLVTQVSTKPALEILINPAKYVSENLLNLKIESYSLSLFKNEI